VPEDLSALGLAYRYLSEREFAYAVWSRLMTDQVLVMALPTETLRLGRDIPPRRPGTAFAPKVLRGNLEPDPADHSKLADALRDVARLVGSLDRSVGDGRGSAAHDWRRWDDRMNWAVNLFRSRQQDLTLFWPPYSEADQERIVKGELPHRAGDPSAHDVQAPVDGTAFGVSREEPCP